MKKIMKRSTSWIVVTAIAVVVAALWIAWHFERDTKVARTKAAHGFEHRGHVWVDHQDEVTAEIANLLNRVIGQ